MPININTLPELDSVVLSRSSIIIYNVPESGYMLGCRTAAPSYDIDAHIEHFSYSLRHNIGRFRILQIAGLIGTMHAKAAVESRQEKP